MKAPEIAESPPKINWLNSNHMHLPALRLGSDPLTPSLELGGLWKMAELGKTCVCPRRDLKIGHATSSTSDFSARRTKHQTEPGVQLPGQP